MVRELTTADGAFAASQDADTEGDEGKTFTWTADEIRDVLGDDAAAFIEAYGVTDDGNWEHTNILSRVVPPTGDPAAEDSTRGVPREAARASGDAGPAGPRRQGARRLERAGDRGLRRRVAATSRKPSAYVAIATRAADAIVAGLLPAGRPARSVVEGRPIDRRGRPRGLRPPGGRPPRPLRGVG